MSWKNTMRDFQPASKLLTLVLVVSLLTGNGGDESYPNNTRVHVFVSWHHQREGQRRAHDLLCSHRDESISVTRDCDALSKLTQQIRLKNTITHTKWP